ncbi:flagellar hook-basal body complex protein FliE [Salinarimonas ramus]|uniref:Flagellar hook-basal body complex protein FliE n=1 Tax=Salinarimonas ramus TaxID=690164 RepID=A0A917Q9I2_9HYPH|nr:flagellar hook-basal body complex protein FliE [Salinarimonas ramus]GGK37292.1 flagellar hook-basal body complex protein FliE [Salinarimonas ramus]
MSTNLFAANAYASVQGIAQGLDRGGGAAGRLGGAGGERPDFGAMVQGALGSVAEAGRAAEAQASAAAAGRADVVDVVTAVAESEAALNTLVAVRDRVIQAYEEIMRMPI